MTKVNMPEDGGSDEQAELDRQAESGNGVTFFDGLTVNRFGTLDEAVEYCISKGLSPEWTQVNLVSDAVEKALIK